MFYNNLFPFQCLVKKITVSWWTYNHKFYITLLFYREHHACTFFGTALKRSLKYISHNYTRLPNDVELDDYVLLHYFERDVGILLFSKNTKYNTESINQFIRKIAYC